MKVSFEPQVEPRSNMERDFNLLANLGEAPAVARVYSWDQASVSLGFSQSRDRDLLPSCQIPSVERPTGGRAVLHGHDVTVGMAIQLAAITQAGESVQGLERSVRKVYLRSIEPLLWALQQVGVPAVMGESVIRQNAERIRSSDCFAAISPNDIVDQRTGWKLCGCALRIYRDAVLVQASIPSQRPLMDPAEVFRIPAPSHWIPIPAEALAEALTESLAQIRPVVTAPT